ncbi:TPA: hypothetical protein J8Z40_002938 [Escherichia coli]|nr:hypothetical protein [Escherichia coli]
MKENLDLFIRKLIHKAFPEFSNKVTWTLIVFGIGIIALPTPTYILFINLIIDFYNKHTQSNITLIDIGNITPSNGFAFALIISGLIYHIIIKGFQTYIEISNENNQKEIQEKKRMADIKLYNDFLEIIPVDSALISLLKDHDFGASFHENKIKTLSDLHYKWGLANQHFHDSEIETKITKLIENLKKFDDFLSTKADYINNSPLLSIVPADERPNDFSWTTETREAIREANKWSSEIYKSYCELILMCKDKLFI